MLGMLINYHTSGQQGGPGLTTTRACFLLFDPGPPGLQTDLLRTNEPRGGPCRIWSVSFSLDAGLA